MKLQKDDWLAIGIFIVVFQILCCWLIDISVSALINDPQAVLVSAWSVANPSVMYHIGIYGIVITTCLMVLILVHVLLKEKKE
jgi:Na+/H+ antiporter NhaD/arsenite permease-like protein